MDRACPADRDRISTITKALEQPTPDAGPLQNLFINTMDKTVMPKEQRDSCLRAVAAEGVRQQGVRGQELTAQLGMSTDPRAPHATAHDWQLAGQNIKAADLLPTMQLSIGTDDSLLTHRANLDSREQSPNGVWQTAYSERTTPDGKRVLQFGDKSVQVEEPATKNAGPDIKEITKQLDHKLDATLLAQAMVQDGHLIDRGARMALLQGVYAQNQSDLNDFARRQAAGKLGPDETGVAPLKLSAGTDTILEAVNGPVLFREVHNYKTGSEDIDIGDQHISLKRTEPLVCVPQGNMLACTPKS